MHPPQSVEFLQVATASELQSDISSELCAELATQALFTVVDLNRKKVPPRGSGSQIVIHNFARPFDPSSVWGFMAPAIKAGRKRILQCLGPNDPAPKRFSAFLNLIGPEGGVGIHSDGENVVVDALTLSGPSDETEPGVCSMRQHPSKKNKVVLKSHDFVVGGHLTFRSGGDGEQYWHSTINHIDDLRLTLITRGYLYIPDSAKKYTQTLDTNTYLQN